MNYATLYSLTSGQKINKIHTFEKYFPLPFDNFIIFQPFSKPAKNYDYFDEVISLIHPILEKNNIKIVQVGGKDERPFNLCFCTQGSTSFGQLEYLISKSKLVLTVDSVSAHIAGHYDIPLVDIVSNNYAKCVEPYFGNKTKQIIFEPDRTNKFPSFSLDEGPIKQVNEILPENIAAAVLKLLSLEFNYPYKTILIGKQYQNRIIESAVDNVIDLSKLGVQNIIMRMDYNFNMAILIQQLSISKCNIITNQPIPINILQQYKPNILGLTYEITDKHNPQFCKELQDNKIPYNLFSKLPAEKLNMIKLDYLDFPIIAMINPQKPEALDKYKIEDLYMKSSKFTLGRGKVYPSKWAYINDIPVDNFNPPPKKLINKNLEALWVDNDFNYFLEKTS